MVGFWLRCFRTAYILNDTRTDSAASVPRSVNAFRLPVYDTHSVVLSSTRKPSCALTRALTRKKHVFDAQTMPEKGFIDANRP